MTLSMSQLFGLVHKPEKSKTAAGHNTQVQRGRGRRRTTPEPRKQDEEQKKEEQPAEEKKSEPLGLTKILDLTYSLLDRIDPVSMNISQGRQASSLRQIISIDTVLVYRQGVTTGAPDSLVLRVKETQLEDVDYGYRMGLNLGGDYLHHPDATNPATSGENLSLRMQSGVKLSTTLSTKLSFTLARKNSFANKSQGEVRTINMDYLPSGSIVGAPKDEGTSFGNQGLPFPSFNLRYSGLRDIKWLKKYVNSASLDMNYSGKRNINMEKGIVTRETYSISFSPLIGLNIQGKKNISGSLNYSLTKNISNSISITDLITSNQTFNQSLNANISYSHKGGLKIPLPLIEDKYLENNIDFRMDISFTNEQEYTGTEGESAIKFGDGKYNKSLSLRPGIQYSFTDKVSGSVSYEYRIVDTRLMGRQDVGDFQFGVNIQIKG